MKLNITIKYILLAVVVIFLQGCTSAYNQQELVPLLQGFGGAVNSGYNNYRINTLQSQQIQQNFNQLYR